MVFAWYMALVEPRNGGTKTLCKCLSPGKQEIMILMDNVPPPFITPRSSKILGRTFLTRIYMTTASLRHVRHIISLPAAGSKTFVIGKEILLLPEG